MILLMRFSNIRAQINTYIQNKTWYWYIPFWLFGAYLFIELLGFTLGEELPFIIAIPQAFDFVLHEMSHLIFAFLPSILVAAAGSFSELFLGIALIITAYKTRSYFASLFCFLWFMLATQSVADYMADARSQSLPLVSFGGGDPIHDWNYIFGKLGLLQYDTTIAALLRGFGIICGAFALVFCLWLMYRMANARFAKLNLEDKQKATDTTLEIGKPTILEPGPGPASIPSASPSELYPTALRGPLGSNHDGSSSKKLD